ncbi:hypothetical protein LSH36_242g06008 [Paralvinella palmiformis]|uniref:Fibrinogen C-terminal domain-containing protein n=1 Tax=Paralvinella palmiformis TaxID=53620 RepID=A0AAD9JNN7_9ANNE|nr:hypothetical protein LSH36_242g06008 [Paralvinella palmiformis]
MKTAFLFILLLGTTAGSNPMAISNMYKAVYGSNVASVKRNMATVIVTSRIECGHACNVVIGCGGFNFRTLETGLRQCELKQGRTKDSEIQDEDRVTYYQNEEQEPSVISRDCLDLQNSGITASGIYEVNLDPDGIKPELIEVYCDMDTDNGGWLVLMKREDGSTDFDRNWTEYRSGFGIYSTEYWLGLETTHRITSNGRIYKLRVDIRKFNGYSYYAKYSSFSIDPEIGDYALRVSGYQGNAGDSLNYHNNMKFSTLDMDNDQADSYGCAATYHGGFWYNGCSDARLTGLYGETVPDTVIDGTTYQQGIFWSTSLGDEHPKYIDMKIRP